MQIGVALSMMLGATLVPGAATAVTAVTAARERAKVVIDERHTMRDEPTPHGAIGTSTAYRISDAVPGRTMEFRKRVLHVGAAIGAHALTHDEVYYVLSGKGEVSSGDTRSPLRTGMALICSRARRWAYAKWAHSR